ncbi:MAG: hypothetical protein AB1898_10665 [Acidobacteriota bacterium]
MLIGRDVPLSLWVPLAYLWQDLLLALLFAGLDLWVRRPWPGWTLYAIFVAYIAVNVPVERVLSTPLTWPLLRCRSSARRLHLALCDLGQRRVRFSDSGG